MAESDTTPSGSAPLAPPAYMRVATLVGLATLLLGLSGLFWLEQRPPTPAFVRVHGVIDELRKWPDVSFEIEATWEDAQGELRGEAGTEGREADVWLFYDAPAAKEVTLIIYRLNEAERRAVASKTRRLERGRLFEIGVQR
ncbi:MAG: hypothetical protein QNJ98_11140 [Planctomycetota bacterium]|nr:hypothetical protein [Planctomycetota bacterium]